MNFDVHITRAAERDINSAADYIEYVLMNPKAADDLMDEAEKAIIGLASFPKKHAIVDDPILKAWGVRFTLIKNYLVFYIVSEEEKRIDIVRFLYGKRNWMSILKQGLALD